MRRKTFLFLVFLILSFCCAASAFAAHLSPAVQPAVFQRMIQAAGTYCEIIESDPDTEYPFSIYIPDLKGSTVTIGFPSTGLRPGMPFLLEIDGLQATVTCARDGKLSLVNGDERIVATGIFSTLECLFDTVLSMLANVFDSILSFDILGVLESIVSGILGVINCIIF
jgi:hypothetical protein